MRRDVGGEESGRDRAAGAPCSPAGRCSAAGPPPAPVSPSSDGARPAGTAPAGSGPNAAAAPDRGPRPGRSIVRRAAWGADEQRRGAVEFDEIVEKIVLHHTGIDDGSGDWAGQVRDIYAVRNRDAAIATSPTTSSSTRTATSTRADGRATSRPASSPTARTRAAGRCAAATRAVTTRARSASRCSATTRRAQPTDAAHARRWSACSPGSAAVGASTRRANRPTSSSSGEAQTLPEHRGARPDPCDRVPGSQLRPARARPPRRAPRPRSPLRPRRRASS